MCVCEGGGKEVGGLCAFCLSTSLLLSSEKGGDSVCKFPSSLLHL